MNCFDRLNRFCVGTLICLALLAAGNSQANAPGYRYELLYYDQQFPSEWLDYLYLAVNRAGEVVFVTKNTVFPNGTDFRFYTVSEGALPTLVTEATRFDNSYTIPVFPTNHNPGINNDGIVSIPLNFPLQNDQGEFVGYETGYRLFESGDVLVGEIRRSSGSIDGSSGRLNLQLEIGNSLCTLNNGQFFTLGPGSERSSAVSCSPRTTQINDSGTVAALVNGQDNAKSVAWATPPGTYSSIVLGAWPFGVNSSRTIGFNNLGYMSYATNTLELADPKVMIISPTGQVITVADTIGGQFLDFQQPRSHANSGVSLNNFNRTSFVADLPVSAAIGESIWVADTSGDSPRLAIDDMIKFTNGWRAELNAFVNDVTSHGANSMSDLGDITLIAHVTALYDDQDNFVSNNTHVLLLAIPEIGGEPGKPILPDEADTLPDGFRFRGRCWRADVATIPGSCDAFGGIAGHTPRTFYDPPVAIGYEFTIDIDSAGAFESVLVPIPLAGGDSEFSVEADGVTVALYSGTAVDFSSITANPVRSFTISGINVAEALDPTDPTAFVTGLTFFPGTDETVSFTMVPIGFDPDLIFKDSFESP